MFSQESYELGEAASKGQQHAFARKGKPEGLSYHKCSARGSQYQQLVQGRRPPHKGHSHRVTRFDTSLVSASGVPRSRLEDARGNKEKTNIYTRRYWVVVVAIEIGDRWSNQPSNFIRMPAEARARSSLPPLQAASFQFWCLAGPPSTSSLRCQPLFADLSLHHNFGGDPPPLRCLLFHTSPPHQQVSSQPGNERVDLFIPCEGLISRVPFYKTSPCCPLTQVCALRALGCRNSGTKQKKIESPRCDPSINVVFATKFRVRDTYTVASASVQGPCSPRHRLFFQKLVLRVWIIESDSSVDKSFGMGQFDDSIYFTEIWGVWNVNMVCCACRLLLLACRSHPLTHPVSHWLTHVLTHSLTNSFAHSLTVRAGYLFSHAGLNHLLPPLTRHLPMWLTFHQANSCLMEEVAEAAVPWPP